MRGKLRKALNEMRNRRPALAWSILVPELDLSRVFPRSMPRYANPLPHQSGRECARRRQQMLLGQLDQSASLRCLERIKTRLA